MIELERTDLGSIAVELEVLDGLVRAAVAGIEGADLSSGRRRLRVRSEGPEVAVEIGITAAGGVVLPVLARTVQARVAEALATALDAPPARVDVSIEAIQRDRAR